MPRHAADSMKYNGLQMAAISASRIAGGWTNLARHISEFCHEDR
jgi:hypothetical protein